jgi:hypothetical protein
MYVLLYTIWYPGYPKNILQSYIFTILDSIVQIYVFIIYYSFLAFCNILLQQYIAPIYWKYIFGFPDATVLGGKKKVEGYIGGTKKVFIGSLLYGSIIPTDCPPIDLTGDPYGKYI